MQSRENNEILCVEYGSVMRWCFSLLDFKRFLRNQQAEFEKRKHEEEKYKVKSFY